MERLLSETNRDRQPVDEELAANHPDLHMVDSQTALEHAVSHILIAIGENPDREGLQRTPHRVAKAFGELLEGYTQDLDTIVNGALFDVEGADGEIVLVKDIEFSSMCEHHLLPFTGKAHVAYIPDRHIIGLSKIPRIVDMFARRLQVQERLTGEIADALEHVLDAKGVMVVVEAQHSCAELRGVEKHGMNMLTSARRGEFRVDAARAEEFYRLLR